MYSYRLGRYRLGRYRLGRYWLGRYRLGRYRLGRYRLGRLGLETGKWLSSTYTRFVTAARYGEKNVLFPSFVRGNLHRVRNIFHSI